MFFIHPHLFALDSEMIFKRYQDTQKEVVDAYVARVREDAVKVEFFTYPFGLVKVKDIRLVSPEGMIYGPKTLYDVSEQAARNLGRLRPILVSKTPKPKSAKAKIGSALLGTGIALFSGSSSSSTPSVYDAGSYAAGGSIPSKTSGLSALQVASGLAPLAVSQVGGSAQGGSTGGEWMKSETAGTGIFSNVAEFACPPFGGASKPWKLEAEMEHRDGAIYTYTFALDPFHFSPGNFPPGPPASPEWDDIALTGPRSKLS